MAEGKEGEADRHQIQHPGVDGDNALDEHALIHFAKVADRLIDFGYAAIPILPISKTTQIVKWSRFANALPTGANIAAWKTHYSEFGAGIVCGACIGIDIDVVDPLLAHRLETVTRQKLGGNPLKLVGKAPKLKLIYRATSQISTSRMPGVDFLGVGSYFVAFGIHPDTRQPYTWHGDSPLTRPWSTLPVVTAVQVAELRAAFAEIMAAANRDTAIVAPPPPAAGPSNLVLDGRDTLLAKLVWQVWAAGEGNADQIADQAFAKFIQTADLTRAKRNGKKPWTRIDALNKAKYLLKRGKVRPDSSTGLGDGLTDEQHNAFEAAVCRVAAHGKLPPAAVAVSSYMLSHAKGSQGCFASPQTIADALDLALETVKRARRRLVELELWTRPNHVNGRGHLAYYFPNLQLAGAIAEKVTKMCTRKSREEEEVQPEDFLNLEKNKTYISVFKSLAAWTGGGDV